MKRVVAFIIALAVCVGLFVPFATSTKTVAAEEPSISVNSTALIEGEKLTVSYEGFCTTGAAYHSIKVDTNSTKDASGSGVMEFSDLTGGIHTVKLCEWVPGSDLVVLQTIEVVVRPCNFSVSASTINFGEDLTVSFTGLKCAANVAYSIQIDNGGYTNISNGTTQTIGENGSGELIVPNLAVGEHKVKLCKYPNASNGFDVLQEITVNVTQPRPTISVNSSNLLSSNTLKVFVDDSAGNVHNNNVYSIAISGPTTATKTISDGSKFTYTGDSVDFDGLKEGTYDVKLVYWKDGMNGTETIQTLTVNVTQVRPTISVNSTEILTSDTLKVFVDDSAGNVHNDNVYSIAISGPTTASKTISDGSKFTYEGDSVDFNKLYGGTYTVKLLYWKDGMNGTQTIQEITVNVSKVHPTIDVTDTEITTDDSLTVYIKGIESVVHDGKDVYSVQIVGGTSKNVSNGKAFTAKQVTFDNLTVGTYTVQLRVWNADTALIDVLQEITITVESAPISPAEGTISTDKTEYWEDEIFIVSYEFDKAIDSTLPETQHRAINIYKGDTLVYVYVANNLQGSSSSKLLWCADESLAGTPGTYTMKVVYKDTNPAVPFVGYEDVTYTFTVKERTEGTTPEAPAISLKEDALKADESLTIQFDGMSMNALDYDYKYTIVLYAEDGTELEKWILWDCGDTYAGLFGSIEYKEKLAAGKYKVELVKSKNDTTSETVNSVTFTVAEMPSTSTGDGTLMVATMLLLIGATVCVQMKRRLYQ